MSNLRSICRPQAVYSTIPSCYRVVTACSGARSITRVSIRAAPNTKSKPGLSSSPSPSPFSPWFDSAEMPKNERPWIWLNQQREGTLEEGETAEARFIKIKAGYELLIDMDKCRQYDIDNRVNPMKASQAWMEWLMKKRKAFDQRGDMAIVAWAEQQQRGMNLRTRCLSRSKVDPDEERRILAKEKKASLENFNNTLRQHTLVLRKRDIMQKKAEEDKEKVISQRLAAEGLELDTDDEEEA